MPENDIVDYRGIYHNSCSICTIFFFPLLKEVLKMHFPKIMCNERKMYYRDIKKFIIYYFIRR